MTDEVMTTATPTARVRRVVQARRVIAPGDLMGAMEAAAALGVEQTNLRKMFGLPKPFQVLGMGSVWLREDIERYREHRRLHPPKPGPKPKQQRVAA